MLGWLTLAVAAIIAALVLMQWQRTRADARLGGRADARSRPANPFAAVTIRPALHSPCEAVLKLQDQRFLAIKAPRIPVSGCDRQRCECRYVRYADRRGTGDRRDPFARFGGLMPHANRERRSPQADRRGKSGGNG